MVMKMIVKDRYLYKFSTNNINNNNSNINNNIAVR
jgi:hypothetical protein